MLQGILYSLTASTLFGYLYYFSTLLLPLNGEDVFGFRIILTVPFILLAVLLFRQKAAFVALLQRIKQTPYLAGIIAINGGILGFQMWLFLWAPNNQSAVSVSLGYLLLPLLMVVVGRFAFKESISLLKIWAVAFAAVGVAIHILLNGGFSWESVAVCAGYSVYFLLRKTFKVADLSSFCLEMIALLPLCFYFAWQVDLTLVQQQNPHILLLLVLLGFISGIALMTYIQASNVLPINLLGLLGYVEPLLMLLVALLIGEQVDTRTYPLLLCLFVAMSLVIVDGIGHLRRHRRLTKR